MYSIRTENIKHKISKGHNLKKERSIDNYMKLIWSKKNGIRRVLFIYSHVPLRIVASFGTY